MDYSLKETRWVLDRLRAAGFTPDAICEHLELWQIRCNARTVKHWYSGKTNIRNVEYRALRDLLTYGDPNFKG